MVGWGGGLFDYCIYYYYYQELDNFLVIQNQTRLKLSIKIYLIAQISQISKIFEISWSLRCLRSLNIWDFKIFQISRSLRLVYDSLWQLKYHESILIYCIISFLTSKHFVFLSFTFNSTKLTQSFILSTDIVLHLMLRCRYLRSKGYLRSYLLVRKWTVKCGSWCWWFGGCLVLLGPPLCSLAWPLAVGHLSHGSLASS